MSQPAGLAPRLIPERRLGGTGRLVLGFIAGTLFALVPMSYFYMGREAALRGLPTPHDQPLASSAETSRPAVTLATAGAGDKPFASRLTYELSRPPDERIAPPSKAGLPTAVAAAPLPVQPPAAAAPSPPASVVIASSPPVERVANARPISTVPPDLRDRTIEIEKEAQKSEYREAPRAQAKSPPEPKATQSKAAQSKAPVREIAAPSAPVPRVFEGRVVDLKPVPPNDSVSPRAEPEAERIAGVTPIKPPAKAGAPTVVATAPSTAPPARAASSAASGNDVEGRLEATRGWLAASPPTTHTIQLMGAGSEEQLKAQLKSLSKVVEPSKLYVFRTKAQGKPSLTVVYGAYADRRSALQALEKLPASITANKPVLRTVNGIRAEMKQHDMDG